MSLIRLRPPIVLAIAALLVASCKDKPADNAADSAAPTTPAASAVSPMASAAPVASASASTTAMDSARPGPHGGHGGHRGPGAMMFRAAHRLDLKDDQKTKVDAAEKSAPSTEDSSKDAMKDTGRELHADLVTGIKAGKIESAKLEPRYAAVEKIAISAHEKEATALNSLHAALDATQRKAVVADVRAKQASHGNDEAKMDHKPGLRARGGDGGAAAADGGHGAERARGPRRMIDFMTKDLGLDADQQKKIDAIAAKEEALAKPPPAEVIKKHMDALLAAFEKDAFDAKKVIPIDGKKARAHLEQETRVLAQIVPILKPEQREKLAAKVEKGPSPHGDHGAGGPGKNPHDDDDNDDD